MPNLAVSSQVTLALNTLRLNYTVAGSQTGQSLNISSSIPISQPTRCSPSAYRFTQQLEIPSSAFNSTGVGS